MKIILLAMAAAAAQGASPTAAQFNAALAAACPEPRTATRNVSCAREAADSIQYVCRYEAQGADGSWAAQRAIIQQAEGEWVWIDGPTRCDLEDQSELN